MLHVEKATGLATVQDLGWETGRAIGLPRSGAIDRSSFRLANALVGNGDDLAGIEMALGALTIGFEDDRRFALTGGVSAELDGLEVALQTTHRARAGQQLVIRAISRPRFGYLAVNGGIAVPLTLGARATYLPTGIGGHQGRRLRSEDRLPLGPQSPAPPVGFAIAMSPPTAGEIRLIAGPQAHLFEPSVPSRLEQGPFTISPTSDRMGTRLLGPSVAPAVKAVLPSEGTCLGALQVPDDGQPIALLADGPTVGGYPKLAVIVTADLDRFVQIGPGESVRFRFVSLGDAELAMSVAGAALEESRARIWEAMRG